MRLSVFLLATLLCVSLSLGLNVAVENDPSVAVEEEIDLDALVADVIPEVAKEKTDEATEEKEVTTGESLTDDVSEEPEVLGEPESETTTATESTTDTTAATESTDSAAAAADSSEAITETATETTSASNTTTANKEPTQSGPFIDLLGPQLYSLQMLGENQVQLMPEYTNEALKGKNVVGLYFSADWCGPCRQFTPELVQFYEKINKRRGQKDKFEIVWISRCRDMNSYAQYFTHMKWLALPPEEAMGPRGQMLGEKYKVKSIPSLVLLDDLGNVITTDARNMIPKDKAGVGFPWRNPLVTLYTTLVPKSFRLLIKDQVTAVRVQLVQRIKGLVGKPSKTTAAQR